MNISHLPTTMGNLLPNEHILSSLSRVHLLSGYRQFTKSIQHITEDTASLNPSAVLRPAYADISQIPNTEEDKFISHLANHSLYDFYKHFSPKCVLEVPFSKKAIFPKGHRNIKHTRSWRWCQDCVKADLQEFAFPYFHTEHQLPSMTRCFKHNRPLFSGCPHCNLDWKKIDHIGLPTTNGTCPKCGSHLLPIDEYQDNDTDWLQASAIKLLNDSTSTLTLNSIQKAYRKHLGIEVHSISGLSLSKSDRRKISSAQNELDNFFTDEFYGSVFHNVTRKGSQKRSSELSIYKAVMEPGLFMSPIIHLMIIRMMFGGLVELESAIES
ncbi:MAG: TniQ family protein [Neptuniibacter sp.]